jgi:hypothetical protein
MLKLAILVLLVGIAYWLIRLKRQGFFKKRQQVKQIVSHVKGEEIQVFLNYDTPEECLKVDGLRFGEQFQYKTIAEIEIPTRCDYITQPVAYTSLMVFQGEDLQAEHTHNALGSLSAAEARFLREALKGVHMAHRNQTSWESFANTLVWEKVRPELCEPLQKLIYQAFSFWDRTPPSTETAPPPSSSTAN